MGVRGMPLHQKEFIHCRDAMAGRASIGGPGFQGGSGEWYAKMGGLRIPETPFMISSVCIEFELTAHG